MSPSDSPQSMAAIQLDHVSADKSFARRDSSAWVLAPSALLSSTTLANARAA